MGLPNARTSLHIVSRVRAAEQPLPQTTIQIRRFLNPVSGLDFIQSNDEIIDER